MSDAADHRGDLLARRRGAHRPLLDALAAQEDTGFEVVVVDDGSSDGTAAVAARRGARVVRHRRRRGLAAARNSGVAAARGEIVAFTDDDCLPARGWLGGLRRAWADAGHDVAGIGGPALPTGPDSAVIRYLELGQPGWDRRRSTSRARPPRPTASSCISCGTPPTARRAARGPSTRSSARTCRFADGRSSRPAASTTAFTFGAEEEELCVPHPRRRLGHRDAAPLHADARVAHVFAPGLLDTLRRSRAYGRGSARLYLKHRRTPTLFPFPLLVGGLALAAARRPRHLPLVALVPLALFSRGPRAALRSRDSVHLAAPFIQLAQEAASDVGFVRGYVQMRGEFARP